MHLTESICVLFRGGPYIIQEVFRKMDGTFVKYHVDKVYAVINLAHCVTFNILMYTDYSQHSIIKYILFQRYSNKIKYFTACYIYKFENLPSKFCFNKTCCESYSFCSPRFTTEPKSKHCRIFISQLLFTIFLKLFSIMGSTSESGYWISLLNTDFSESYNQTETMPCTSNEIIISPRKRGVKKGCKRGKYEKSTELIRSRVITAKDNEEDWVAVASANGIKTATAYNWVHKGTAERKPRGGIRQKCTKLCSEHVEAIIDWISDNPLLTLKSMASKLVEVFGVEVSTQTVARHLEYRMITLKSVHYQPEAANNDVNKKLRKQYVKEILKVKQYYSFLFYSNENLLIFYLFYRPIVRVNMWFMSMKAT